MFEDYGAAEYRCFIKSVLNILQDFRQYHNHNENDLPVLKQVENFMGINRSIDPEVWLHF